MNCGIEKCYICTSKSSYINVDVYDLIKESQNIHGTEFDYSLAKTHYIDNLLKGVSGEIK